MATGEAQPAALAHRSAITRHAAEKVFFPAAALHAGVTVPASVHGMLSGDPLLPSDVAALATASGLWTTAYALLLLLLVRVPPR